MRKAVSGQKTRQPHAVWKMALFAGASLAMFAITGIPVLAQGDLAQADNENDTLEEVIVTSQRRAQSLQDVPISITAFTDKDIASNNFQGIGDYFFRAPNVSFTSTGSRDRKEISIRGITNQLSSDNDVRASTFGFYIDEFNVSTGTVNPPILDVERIEILRGPQGTFFGRNSIGGAINMTTKMPNDQFFSEASADFSTFNTIDAHGILNVPLLGDKLAARLVGKFSHSDGNIKNINAIGGGNDSTYKYFRGTLRFVPTERLTVDFIGSYSNELVGMREGVPSGVLSVFARNIFFGGDPNAQALPDGVGFYPQNTNRVNFNRKQNVGNKYWYVTGRARFEADNFTVTSITGFINSDIILNGDIDGSSLDLAFENKPQSRDSLSQEIRIASKPGVRLDWTIGGIYARDRGNTDQETFAGADNPFGVPNGFRLTSTKTAGKSKSVAGFGEGVWHFTEALSFTFGGRLTYEKVKVVGFNTSGGNVNNQIDDTASFTNFSPRFSISYILNTNSTVYATVSRGFKSGGVQLNLSIDNPSFDPETLWNYEAGIKTELFDRRLRINADGFYMDWSKLQTDFAFGVVDADGNIGFEQGIENAASAHSAGFEIEATALPVTGLITHVSVGYLEAKFDNFKKAFIEGQTVDLSGFRQPNAPKWTLSADAEYGFAVTDRFDAFVRVEWFHRSSIVATKNHLVLSGFPFQVPSFGNTNLRIGIDSELYSLVAYAENLFNQKYFTNAFQKAFVGGVNLEPSVQVFGLRLTVRTN